MKITNLITNQHPNFVHACSGWSHHKGEGEASRKRAELESPLWKPIRQRLFNASRKNHGPIKDLTMVVFNNTGKKGWFEKSADLWGIPYTTLGQEISEWANVKRIHYLLKHLCQINTKYTLHADSFDILIIRPDQIINKFLSFNAKMLVNSEIRFHPTSTHKWMLKKFDFKEWIDFEKSISTSYCRFLNAGLWMADTVFCTTFLERCLHHTNKMSTTSDQALFHLAFKDYYPEVKLDDQCMLFQSLKFQDSKMISFVQTTKML